MSVRVKTHDGPIEFKAGKLFRVIDKALFVYDDSGSDAIGCAADGEWTSAEIRNNGESDVVPLAEDPVEYPVDFKEVDRNELDREMADADTP